MEKINKKANKYVPQINGTLRGHMINVPSVIRQQPELKFLERE
jgi:hypothetical protein